MEEIPVVFSSDKAFQQAWDLMRQKGGAHLTYLAFADDHHVLGVWPHYVEEFRRAKIPFMIVEKPQKKKANR